MTLREKVIEVLGRMEEPLQAEVLDFAEYLEQRTRSVSLVGRDDQTQTEPEPGRGGAANQQGKVAPPLSSLIGSCKGMFKTPEDADAFLACERDAWGT